MNHRIEYLGQVAERWLNPDDAFRSETIQALQVSTGYSRRSIERALASCFEELTCEKLLQWMSGRRTSNVGRTVLHILPANAFTAWVHGVVLSLLSGWKVALKPSFREPVFPMAWKKSLERMDERLSELVDIVAWSETLLCDFDVVVAYGSDETLRLVQASVPAGTRFVGYGHQLSVGVVFEEAQKELSNVWMDRIIADAEPFRLQGCLSPQVIFVENLDPSQWQALGAALEVAPRLEGFKRWQDVLDKMRTLAPHLSCVGYAGETGRQEQLERDLQGLGVSRLCPLGQMQRPPLDWLNGGVNLADVLHSVKGETSWENQHKVPSIGA